MTVGNFGWDEHNLVPLYVSCLHVCILQSCSLAVLNQKTFSKDNRQPDNSHQREERILLLAERSTLLVTAKQILN